MTKKEKQIAKKIEEFKKLPNKKPKPLPEYTVNTGRIKSTSRYTKEEKLNEIYLWHSKGDLQKNLKIPASTISRFQTGKMKPSLKTINKIIKYSNKVKKKEIYDLARSNNLDYKEASALRSWNRDRAIKYISLRKAGDNKTQAKGYSLTDHEYIHNRKERLNKVAEILSLKHSVKIEHIKKGMSYSDRSVDDWDIYISEIKNRKLKK